jgi:pimeloyl-ACP methyl ester carboxylesterase
MTETLRLDGGRMLAFQEWGDAQGPPVIHLHGAPGSRLERFPDQAALAELGVRLITFDRPGYGLSDPMPGRTLRDCAADVGRLADHLGLTTFALNGISAGGPYVLATSCALGARVTRAAISCGLGPLDRAGAFDGMSENNTREFDVALHDPARLEDLLADADLASGLPESEMAALGSIPDLAQVLMEGLPEATRQGWAGALSDDFAFVGEWGFDLREISVSLSLWHGDDDPIIPFHHSEYVAGQVPGAQLHRCRGEGHVAMFGHQAEILTWLTQRLDGNV